MLKLRNGSEIIVRSRWEAAFIKDYLEPNELTWKYEPKTFKLPDGRLYTPDFLIDDDMIWVEVKGRGTSDKPDALRALGENVIFADRKVLEDKYGLDLSISHLNGICQKV